MPARTLAFVGDVMLGRLVDAGIAERGFAHPWGDVLPLLRRADLVFVNLECALTNARDRSREGAVQAFYLRACPSAVEMLKVGGVRFASLANDHTCDYGFDALEEMRAVLDKAGIAHAGAGRDLREASAPALLDAGGLSVAVVACAAYPSEWAATAESPGIHYVPVPPKPSALAELAAAVAEAKRLADLCVFSVHGSSNLRDRPPREFREFTRRIVEAGADIVWGHSAHVVQGVEWHRGKPILYDTGDFIDDYAVDETLRNDLSGLFLVTIDPPGPASLRVVPVAIADLQVNVARGPDREWFVAKLEGLCAEMGTAVTDEGREVRIEPAPPDPAERAGAA